MDTLQAILLGIVQGITEFLPVSSSGHLQIAKELLGVELEENLTFDVALHAATVLSTIVVLWSEVWRLLKGLFSRRFNAEQAYVLKLVLSMIPIGFVGFLFKERINALLDAPYILVIVGAMLLLTAALLAFAYYAKPRQKETISYRDAFIIGLAQACAAMPGLSRSGTTIATGLLLGNKKAAVAQFSFLMVLAPILGETLLEAVSGDLTARAAPGPNPGAARRGGRAAPAGDRAGLCSRAPKRGLRRGNERFPLISAVFLQIMLAFPLGM